MPFGPAQDPAAHGRVGALMLHATHDPRETTLKARQTFNSSFLQQVDPQGILDEAERLRRAEYARRAHFARMALISARNRSKGKNSKQNAEPIRESPASAETSTGGDGRARDQHLESE